MDYEMSKDKFIKRFICSECNKLKFSEKLDCYICMLEPEGVNQYVEETKWQISGDTSLRRCLKR